MPLVEETKKIMRIIVRGTEELVKVDDVIVHQNYLRSGIFKAENDLAIYKLKAPLNFTRFVQPACLKLGKQESYENLKVAGNCLKTKHLSI